MAKAKPYRFPEHISVTRESLNDGEDYLQVHEEGLIDDESIDTSRPAAVYKLVNSGEVEVTRRYVESTAKKARA